MTEAAATPLVAEVEADRRRRALDAVIVFVLVLAAVASTAYGSVWLMGSGAP